MKFMTLNGPDADVVFVPYTQNPWPSTNLLVRSSGGAPVEAVRRIVSTLDASLPLSNIQHMGQVVTGSVAQPRLLAGLVGALAAAALFLSAVGIFGLMAYLVSQRSPEISIRIALGARQSTVFGLVIGEGMKLAAIGVALGLLLSLALARLISTLLFRTSPNDLTTLVAVSAVLLSVAFAACYFPSRRAMRLDPVRALRNM